MFCFSLVVEVVSSSSSVSINWNWNIINNLYNYSEPPEGAFTLFQHDLCDLRPGWTKTGLLLKSIWAWLNAGYTRRMISAWIIFWEVRIQTTNRGLWESHSFFNLRTKLRTSLMFPPSLFWWSLNLKQTQSDLITWQVRKILHCILNRTTEQACYYSLQCKYVWHVTLYADDAVLYI